MFSMKKLSLLLALLVLFTSVLTSAAHAQERKKWSPQAKGAVIGGLGGAAAGAIIHKRNRPVGGVVGGVAGAGVGYAIGKRTDNKRKAEAARVAAARRAEAQRAAAYRAGLARGSAKAKTSGVATPGTAPVVASALAAGTGAALLYDANGNPITYAAGAPAAGIAYLPNNEYGSRDAAYPESQVRRKSW